jgi:hypothetical protein
VFDNIDGLPDSGDDKLSNSRRWHRFRGCCELMADKVEADCFRLGEESLRVIDHMNAIGAPFAREYGTPTGAITAGVDRIGSN